MGSANGRFSRIKRLNRPAEFQALFASGKRIGTRQLLVIALSNNKPYARLGLAISKRNVPLATRRNRLKRIVRESFRRHQKQLQGHDILVLVKKNISEITDQALVIALEKNWNKLEK